MVTTNVVEFMVQMDVVPDDKVTGSPDDAVGIGVIVNGGLASAFAVGGNTKVMVCTEGLMVTVTGTGVAAL